MFKVILSALMVLGLGSVAFAADGDAPAPKKHKHAKKAKAAKGDAGKMDAPADKGAGGDKMPAGGDGK